LIVPIRSVWIQTVAPVNPASGAILSAVREDVLKFLRGLRAVREYTPEAVPEDAISEILEVGRWTSTGGNRQPSEVIVVRDPQVRQKFADWGAKPAGPAPVSLLLVTKGDQSAFDEGRLAERLALAARAFGLGSCIATLKNEGPEAAKQLLGIPPDRRARTLVTLGHTDVEARRALPKAGAQARKPMQEFVHRDRY
jgi:nitroreductase